MMDRRRVLAAALAALALVGAAPAQEGESRAPPFITTPDDVVERMLVLAGTGAGDFVIDLG